MLTSNIDGGVLANNPSLFAQLMAQTYYNQPKIRLISFGCGKSSYSFNKKKLSKAQYLLLTVEWMMNADGYNVIEMQKINFDYALKANGDSGKKINYMRVDGNGSGLSLSATDPKSVQKLVDEGNNVWKANGDNLKKVVE